MGILQLPRRHDYWRTTKWLFATNFGAIMSRDNFNLIWRYIHLQDNNVPAPANEKLWKLRWFIDHLNTRFQSVYTPYENVTIDESMIKFKGRLGFRQYMPAKPIKWGIKVWALCESNTGYAYHIQVYTGKV
ncbi:MAG: transposase, partial [Chromatiales bacterium]